MGGVKEDGRLGLLLAGSHIAQHLVRQRCVINLKDFSINSGFVIVIKTALTVPGGFTRNENGIGPKLVEGVLHSADLDQLQKGVETLGLGNFQQTLGPIRNEDVVDHVDQSIGAQDVVVAEQNVLHCDSSGIALESVPVAGERPHAVVFDDGRRAQRMDQNVVLKESQSGLFVFHDGVQPGRRNLGESFVRGRQDGDGPASGCPQFVGERRLFHGLGQYGETTVLNDIKWKIETIFE